MINKET